MIEKLKNKLLNQIFVDKINELVDFANKLRKELDDKDNEIRAWIDMVEGSRRSIRELENFIYTPHNEAPDHVKNIPDPYAEQRKWIGKACWFWDEEEEKVFGILTTIDSDCGLSDMCPYWNDTTKNWFEHCEPVKDDIIYKKD